MTEYIYEVQEYVLEDIRKILIQLIKAEEEIYPETNLSDLDIEVIDINEMLIILGDIYNIDLIDTNIDDIIIIQDIIDTVVKELRKDF